MERDFASMFDDTDDPQIRRRQIQVLRRAVIGLAQDVHVLKELLAEHQLFDAARFKALRMRRMVADHNGAGLASYRRSSYYPYALDEEGYLRAQFAATDEEVRAFNAEVEFVSQLT